MACTEDNHLRNRQDGLHENLHFAATDQSTFGHGFLGEVKGHNLRFFLANHVLGSRPDFGFDAPSTHGTEGGAVIPDEHLCGLKARNRAANLDDCGQGSLAALLPHLLNFVEQVNLHRPLSLTYSLTLLVPVS